MLKAVILIGGPQKGTRFRPLSLDVPKPLFPVAGYPIMHHHIEACSKVPTIKEILIIGFFQPSEDLNSFVMNAQNEFKIPIRYLQEYTSLGTAGGIYHFRDLIQHGNPEAFFVLNGDTCGDFPLNEMLEFHRSHNSNSTMLGTEATEKQSVNYGCIVEDKETHQVLHYVEKPETFVSTTINCGVYLFNRQIFEFIGNVNKQVQSDLTASMNQVPISMHSIEQIALRDSINLEKQVLAPLSVLKSLYVYKTDRFWSSIKSAGAAIYANRHYLDMYKEHHPNRLATNGDGKPKIIGDVFIHPTASVDPTAVLGPNVSIGQNVNIGPGVRIRESVILGNTILQDHSCILYSIIGWNSCVGCWTRIEGTPSDPDPNKPFAKIDHLSLFTNGKLNPSITVIGSHVSVPSEIIIRYRVFLN